MNKLIIIIIINYLYCINVNIVNIGLFFVAVMFECIQTVTRIYPLKPLLDRAAKKTTLFLISKASNLKCSGRRKDEYSSFLHGIMYTQNIDERFLMFLFFIFFQE